jgi:vanillate/3-O-methylgallate O-demethylase
VDQCRLEARPGAAPRHGRRARPRDLGPVWRPRIHPLDDPGIGPRRRRRPAPGRQPRLLDQHAGIGLDPLAAAGHLHRRRHDEDYRDWLGADSYEASGAIGGSYVSKNIEDYYVNPFELGYGFYIGWKSDFIGKPALEKLKTAKNRKKVTFQWNAEDVVKVIASAFQPGEDHYKWIDFPQPNYASTSADMVMHGDKMVGMSMFNGYSYNERSMLSLGVVDADVQEGDVLTMIWGEPDGGSGKTSTERHKQAEIRVRVSPTPFAAEARENYADSWRTKK